MTQPSQRRYVFYFAQLLKEKIYFPLVRTIKAITVNKLNTSNSDAIRPYFEIYFGNGDKISFTNKTSYSNQKKIMPNGTDLLTITDTKFGLMITGDATLKIYNNLLLSTKKLGRISFNTAFLTCDQTELVFKIKEIDPDNLVKKKKIPKDFEIQIKFGQLCGCMNRETPINICKSCSEILVNELADWKEITMILEVKFILIIFFCLFFIIF